MEPTPLFEVYTRIKSHYTISEEQFYKYLYGKYFEYCKWQREHFQTSYKSDAEFLLNWTVPLFIEAMNEYITQSRKHELTFNAILFKDYINLFTGFDRYVSEFMKYYDDFVPKIEKDFQEKYNDGTGFFRIFSE